MWAARATMFWHNLLSLQVNRLAAWGWLGQTARKHNLDRKRGLLNGEFNGSFSCLFDFYHCNTNAKKLGFSFCFKKARYPFCIVTWILLSERLTSLHKWSVSLVVCASQIFSLSQLYSYFGIPKYINFVGAGLATKFVDQPITLVQNPPLPNDRNK